MSIARKVAFQILLRAERGGYASDLLMRLTRELDSRDAGLASEIVFGCLRYRSQLDHMIGLFSSRPVRSLDPEVRGALRMGVYQIRHLDRVPQRAAVDESVELVKHSMKRSAAGFVNAVLRKVGRDPVEWPDRATELSLPNWMLERWENRFGQAEAARIAEAFLSPPEKYVRIPSLPPPAHLKVEETEVAGCFRLLAGDPVGLRTQDIGSQSIVPLLALRSEHTFLDLCAAPGNKTAQALEAGVTTVACDYKWDRLRQMKSLRCSLVAADCTELLPFRGSFDRILLDAPCSGTGTLGRNPEIKWRLREPDLKRLHELQVRLLRRALEYLAPGGRLVYSTCSLEQEENEEVVREVLGHLPTHLHRRMPGTDPGDGFFAAVIPSD